MWLKCILFQMNKFLTENSKYILLKKSLICYVVLENKILYKLVDSSINFVRRTDVFYPYIANSQKMHEKECVNVITSTKKRNKDKKCLFCLGKQTLNCAQQWQRQNYLSTVMQKNSFSSIFFVIIIIKKKKIHLQNFCHSYALCPTNTKKLSSIINALNFYTQILIKLK